MSIRDESSYILGYRDAIEDAVEAIVKKITFRTDVEEALILQDVIKTIKELRGKK